MAGRTAYTNIHGRRWGRGVRPYLLIPKILCVSVFFGGVVSTWVLVFLQPTPATVEEWLARAALSRQAFVWIIVPAIVGALLTGSMLGWMHLRAFLRMRWFQVKLLVVVLCVPALHVFMRTRSVELRAVLNQPDGLVAASQLWSQMRVGMIVTIGFALVMIILGRIKPRLGQDYGRVFS